MLEFMIGLFVGSFIGVALMCCLFAASRADESMQNQEGEEDKSD